MPTNATLRYDIAARLDPAVMRRTARARDAYMSGRAEPTHDVVRPEILQSWRRSRGFGVPLSGSPMVETPPVPTGHVLASAAGPVLLALGEEATDMGFTGIVVDRHGTQILPTAGDARFLEISATRGAVPGGCFSEEFAGTNGAGLSLLRHRPVAVVGHEHYQDLATRLVTFGVPLRDALNRVQGHFVLCATTDTAHPIMIPHAMDIAATIGERLIEATDRRDRVAFMEFLRHASTPSTPVMVFNDRFCCLNTVAQQMLLEPQDIDLVRNAARDAVSHGRSGSIRLTLGVDTYRLRCRVVSADAPGDGIVVTFRRETTSMIDTAHPEPAAEAGIARLRRARERGIPALVRGERGSDRRRLAHSTGALAELAAADAAADEGAWLERLAAALRDGDVLIIDIGDGSAPLRRAALQLVREATHWCVATCGPDDDALELQSAFPVVIDRAPLRARREEIPNLVLQILAEAGAARVRLSQDAKSVLARYAWPGNEQQLRATILDALTQQSGGRITLEHLPRSIAAGGVSVSGGTIDQMERELIFEALRKAGWRRDAAADALGISRSTLYRKLRRFPFEVPSSRT